MPVTYMMLDVNYTSKKKTKKKQKKKLKQQKQTLQGKKQRAKCLILQIRHCCEKCTEHFEAPRKCF